MTTTGVGVKHILLATVGQDQKREIQVELAPGTTVADVLEQAGFLGFRMVNPRGGHFEALTNLYDEVAEGQKVNVVKVDDFSAG